MSNVLKAVLRIRPKAKFAVVGEDTYANINWLDEEQTKPTEQEFNEALVIVENQAKLDSCKTIAKQKIAATDWSVLPDVGISNTAEFETYRAALRELIKNPVADPVWPTEPEPVWS